MVAKSRLLLALFAPALSHVSASAVPVSKVHGHGHGHGHGHVHKHADAIENSFSDQDNSGLGQSLSIASYGDEFATAEFGFSHLSSETPNMTSICIVALACMGVVVLLDLVGHFLEMFIENEEDKELLDEVIDGVAAISLFIIAGLWGGLLSEYIATKEYSTGRFPDVAFPVFLNKLIIIPIAGVSMAIAGQLWPERDPSLLTSAPGIMAGVEGILSEKALLFITYPVVAVFKSTTVIPTMIFNRFVNDDRANISEYAFAVLISICVLGFSLANARDSSAPHPSMAIGCSMMGVFLMLYAFLGVSQKKIFNAYPNFTTLQMMMLSCIWAAAFAFIEIQATTGIQPLITFLGANPECVKHLAANGVAGTIFLYLLFYIVKHQGPVMLCVITSVEKIISVLLSAVLYDHPLTTMALSCAFGAILGALCITFLSMKRKRRELALKRTGHLRNLFRATARMRGFSHGERLGESSSVSAAAKVKNYSSVDDKDVEKVDTEKAA